MPISMPSPVRRLCVPIDTKIVTCRARRTAVCDIRFVQWHIHADVITFGHNNHNSRKQHNILDSADTSKTVFLALTLELKYEIQVPNIGGQMHCGPQPNYWESMDPRPPSTVPAHIKTMLCIHHIVAINSLQQTDNKQNVTCKMLQLKE